MEQEKLAAAVQLMRRLPPQKINYNATAVSNLIPEIAEDFLSKIDKPLEIGTCAQTGQNYIKCEFNRDGDSFRSPYSNQYDTPLEDGVFPLNDTRNLEEKAQALFVEYQKLYYQGGLSNIYFFDKDDGSFACAFVVKKGVELIGDIKKGTWDSINVVDVKFADATKKKFTYKCTGSVVLELEIQDQATGSVNITGSLTKTKEETKSVEPNLDLHSFHLRNIGQIIEDMEYNLRSNLDTIYVGKTKQTIFEIRDLHGHQQIDQLKKGIARDLLSRQSAAH